MKSFTPYDYIRIGLVIRFLRNSTGETKQSIKNEIDNFPDELSGLGFHVSIKGLHELIKFGTTLNDDEGGSISLVQGNELSRIMEILEKMVFAEAQTKQVYTIGQDRYSLEYLLNKPEKMFTNDVFNKFTPITKYDLTEGFKCLALHRSTAAAFHILRATEAALKSYYIEKVKRNRERNPMMGNMITGLRAKRGSNSTLLDRLDFIRTAYRNPTNHPEAIYGYQEAQDLLGVCIDVLNTIGKELP